MYSASLSPDKKTFVSGGEDCKIYRFSYEDGKEEGGHTEFILILALPNNHSSLPKWGVIAPGGFYPPPPTHLLEIWCLVYHCSNILYVVSPTPPLEMLRQV